MQFRKISLFDNLGRNFGSEFSRKSVIFEINFQNFDGNFKYFAKLIIVI